ncbi:hypothetical protein LSH36_224g01022, partial [Paralvinella palmiformis]
MDTNKHPVDISGIRTPTFMFPRVTAFALRTLNDANDKDWELTMFIPTILLKKIAGWNVPNCDEAMKAAQSYLEKALPGIKDVYTFAIVTYALHLTGSSESSKAFYMLKDLQRQ